jgi:hypothetical protein
MKVRLKSSLQFLFLSKLSQRLRLLAAAPDCADSRISLSSDIIPSNSCSACAVPCEEDASLPSWIDKSFRLHKAENKSSVKLWPRGCYPEVTSTHADASTKQILLNFGLGRLERKGRIAEFGVAPRLNSYYQPITRSKDFKRCKRQKDLPPLDLRRPNLDAIWFIWQLMC